MDKSYADTVRLLLTVAPAVFANDIFAMKGGTAINLFVQDMPRLSVDIDVVYLPWQVPRDDALRAINQELTTISARVETLGGQAGGRARPAAPARSVRRMATLRIGRHHRRHGGVLRGLSGRTQSANSRSTVRQQQGYCCRVRPSLHGHDRSRVHLGYSAGCSRTASA
jgi:Nucleotidyl transferase AbiEii toxin, Type IV TA system